MEYDTDKVDEDVLALLYLVSFRERREEAWRAWKGQDWEVMDRLHQKGYISDPKNRNKSVCFSDDGYAKAKELFEKKYQECITVVGRPRRDRPPKPDKRIRGLARVAAACLTLSL